MRKILYALAVGLSSGCLASAQTTTVNVKTFFDRSAWTVTVCGDANEGAHGGRAQHMLDDDTNTFWHQDWNSDTQKGTYHWALVDMQESKTVNGFTYLPRQDSDNGRWFAGKIYVYAEAPETPTHESVKALYDGDTEPSGSFRWTFGGGDRTERECVFPSAATGRYALVVIADSHGTGASHACCAEFKPYVIVPTEVPATVTFSPVLGDDGNGSYNNPGGWSSVFNPTVTEKAASIRVKSGAANMGKSADGLMDFRSGTIGNSVYVVTSTDPCYYVSSVSFTATGANNIFVQPIHRTRTALSTDGVDFSFNLIYGEPCEFTVSGANTENKLSNFTITLAAKDEAAMAKREKYLANIELAELWRPVLGDALFNTAIDPIYAAVADDQSDEAIAEACNAAASAWMDEANGRPVYLRNVRRNGQPYLVATSATTTNTNPAKVNEAGWMIKKSGEAGGFKLFNMSQRSFLASNGGLVAQEENGVVLNLAKNTDSNFPGTALKFNDTKGLNVDNASGNGTTYNYNDGGSSWIISLLGMQPSEITSGKYVRIRSARGLALNQGTGSLIGVPTTVEDNQAAGDVPNSSARPYGLGAIWKVEAVEGENVNRFYLRNMAADYAESGSEPNYLGSGGANSNVSNNKGEFTFVSAVGTSNFQRQLPNGIVIKVGTGNTYLDVANYGTGISTWNQVDNGWPNNGGIYYFEEATDFETVKAAYIAGSYSEKTSMLAMASALTAQQEAGVADFSALVSEINDSVAAYGDYLPTTVAEANRLKLSGKQACFDKFSDEYVRQHVTSAVAGNYYLVKSRMVNANTGHNCSYMTVNGNLDALDLNNTIDDNPRRGVWHIGSVDEDGKITLGNEHAGKLMKQATAINTAMPIVDDGSHSTYFVHFNHNQGSNGGFGFTTSGNLNSTTDGVHCASGVQNIVAWCLADADNSWFDLIALDGDVEPTVNSDKETGNVEIVFPEGAACCNVSEGVVISVNQIAASPVAPAAEGADEDNTEALPQWTFASSDISEGKINISGVPAGNYEMNIPAAFFAVNGKYNSPRTYSFSVSDPSGIDGVISESNRGADVVYDLQGRRLARPVKGINIINGQKVLVK